MCKVGHFVYSVCFDYVQLSNNLEQASPELAGAIALDHMLLLFQPLSQALFVLFQGLGSGQRLQKKAEKATADSAACTPADHRAYKWCVDCSTLLLQQSALL